MSIRILAYHSIVKDEHEKESKIDIPLSKFKEQIAYIMHNYKVISLETALKLIAEGNIHKENYVILTFDDGYKDFSEIVFPFLLKKGLHSTVYVITSLLENPNYKYDLAFGNIKHKEFMSYKDIENLSKEFLVNIGSHSHRHLNFYTENLEVIQYDLSRSYIILKEILGRNEIDFCYPWGLYKSSDVLIIRRFFRSGVSGDQRIIVDSNRENFYCLPRIPIKDESFSTFIMRLKSGFPWEGVARKWKHKVKKLFFSLMST